MSDDVRSDYVTDALEAMPPSIMWAVRDRPRSRSLVVVVSSRAKYELGNIDFKGHAVLDVVDLQRTYFMLCGPAMMVGIWRFIEDNDFTSINFIGCSKGAFGALLLSREVAKRTPTRSISAIAFSPQTRLWPANDLLKFTSYKHMVATAPERPKLLAQLQRHGDQSRPVNLANLRWFVFYGAGNEADVQEAGALRGTSVHLEALPLTTHLTIIAYLGAGMSEPQKEEMLNRLAYAAKTDGDIAVSLSGDKQAVIKEILGISPRASLPDTVNWAMERSAIHLAQHGRPSVQG